jgi:hypothetical protein
MEHHELPNLVTVWHIRRALTEPAGGWNGGFRSHPLFLRRHEQDMTWRDLSVLNVTLPLHLGTGKKTEPEEMLQPLAELCERVGEQMPAQRLDYDWYFLELLDRDRRLAPFCWIDPDLLYEFFPDQGTSITQEQFDAMSPQEREEEFRRQMDEYRREVSRQWPRQLVTMDWVARSEHSSDSDLEKREKWWEWLVRTWRDHEPQWLQQGRLIYDTVLPWSQMLDFDAELVETDLARTQSPWVHEVSPTVPRRYSRARAGHQGLYWKKIPLYDRECLSQVWEAMKEVMWITSVFNVAAKQEQDPKLWKGLEERFFLPFQRMSRYEYLVRWREQMVLEWRREGKTLDEIATLLVDTRLYPLDPRKAARISRMRQEVQSSYHASAWRVAERILKRLREEGLVQRGKPGRPRKEPKAPEGEVDTAPPGTL